MTWWESMRSSILSPGPPLVFDGAMGTELYARGLERGGIPSRYSREHPEIVADVHRAYLEAGAAILTTNSFNTPALAISDPAEARELVTAAVELARRLADSSGRNVGVACDLGPTARLLEPLGELPFETAVTIYRDLAAAGQAAGADLILIETMTDTYELKAAIVGAREGATLPIFATWSPDSSGRLLTGADLETTAAIVEGLGVAALGINCATGPAEIAPQIARLARATALPLIARPNAGVPHGGDSDDAYLDPGSFRAEMAGLLGAGVRFVGGCCGTNPAHIRELAGLAAASHTGLSDVGERAIATSQRRVFYPGDVTYQIGARLVSDDPVGEALDQLDEGCDFIAVPADPELVAELEPLVNAPLVIVGDDPVLLEATLRLVRGRPLVQVSGPEAYPAAATVAGRYGAAVRVPGEASHKIHIPKGVQR
ncbi:MAG: homocysteine S-methyltransferase family protein [Bacillota bacterium]|nr:homocysteine S-methyltransferase family protein [Bacillota bacterium]